MILGAFSFATMGVGLKVASGSFNTFELVLYRGVVGVLVMGWVLRVHGTPLRTAVPLMHAWRSVVGGVSLVAWFYAIAHLPLATAMTLNYTSGVWVSAFILGGALLYGKAQRQGPLMSTILLGFGGVILMLRPTIDQTGRRADRGGGAVVDGLHAVGSHHMAGSSVDRTDRTHRIAGPVVHDARLQPRPHPGGDQPAVPGHRICRALQPSAVWRRHCAHRLAGHGHDCCRRRGGYLLARARVARHTG